MNKNEGIKISVAIPSYNHDKFIGEAIQSVLDQEVNFNYEIIIADDNSTDRTRKIIEEFKKKSDNIITKHSEENSGVFEVVKRIYNSCRGEYIALLEADDKWIYNKKLQEQVDYLNNNPDYVAVVHDAEIKSHYKTEDLKNKLVKHQGKQAYNAYSDKFKYRDEYSVKDLIERKNLPSSSILFRKNDYKDFFNKYTGSNLTLSWFFHLQLIQDGRFKYIDKKWSLYNDHKGGVTKNISFTEFNKKNIFIFKELLKKDFFSGYKKLIYKSISDQYKFIALNPLSRTKPFLVIYGLIKFVYYRLKSILIKDKT